MATEVARGTEIRLSIESGILYASECHHGPNREFTRGLPTPYGLGRCASLCNVPRCLTCACMLHAQLREGCCYFDADLVWAVRTRSTALNTMHRTLHVVCWANPFLRGLQIEV